MKKTNCPNCGGEFETKLLGRLKDKVMKCPYCATIVDVPDQSEIVREESYHDESGQKVDVKVTERRADMGSEDMASFLKALDRGNTEEVESLLERWESMVPESFNSEMFQGLQAQGVIPKDVEYNSDSSSNNVFIKDENGKITRLEDLSEEDRKYYDDIISDDNPKSSGKLYTKIVQQEQEQHRTQSRKSGFLGGLVSFVTIVGFILLIIEWFW